MSGALLPDVGGCGTAATGKVWVDLYTDQIIDGYKQFSHGIKVPDTSSTGLPLTFNNGNTGFYYHTNSGLTIKYNGINSFSIESTGNLSRRTLTIKPDSLSNASSLDVYEKSGFTYGQSPFIQRWLSTTGAILASVGTIGDIAANSLSLNVVKPSSYPYYVTHSTSMILINTSGLSSSPAIVLMNSSGLSGRLLTIKDIGGNASGQPIIVSGLSGQKIDNVISSNITIPYGKLNLIADNGNWWIV